MTLTISDSGSTGDESYVLTIPTEITITTSGWNEFSGGITAQANSGSTFSGTLTVTASSDNSWSLVLSPDKDDSVGYTLASQDNGAQNLTWTFTSDEVNADGGTSKTVGVIVENYTGKTAGTYEDTITFTAGVVEEATKLNGTIVVSGYYSSTNNLFSATATLDDENISVTSTEGADNENGALHTISLTYNDGKLTISMTRSTSSKTVTVDLRTGEYTQVTSGNATTAGKITLSGITLNGNAITLTLMQ